MIGGAVRSDLEAGEGAHGGGDNVRMISWFCRGEVHLNETVMVALVSECLRIHTGNNVSIVIHMKYIFIRLQAERKIGHEVARNHMQKNLR